MAQRKFEAFMSVETKLALIDQNIGFIKDMLIKHDKRFDFIDSRFETLEKKFDSKFETLEKKFDSKFETLDTKMDSNFKWLLGMIIGLGGLLLSSTVGLVSFIAHLHHFF